MAHQPKNLIVGAGFGLTVLVVAEAVRHLLGESRSPAEMMWGLWVIPFAAFMWSIGRSAHRSRTRDSPEQAETWRQHA